MSDPLALSPPLAPLPRAVLELLAAAHDGLTATQLAHCVNHLGLGPEVGRHDARSLLGPLQALEDRGLLVFGQGHRYELPQRLAEPLLAALIEAGRFEALAEVVSRQQPTPDLELGSGLRAGILRRELRRALWAGDGERLSWLLASWTRFAAVLGAPPRLAGWVDHPAGLELMRRVEPEVAGRALEDLSLARAERMTGEPSLLPLLRELHAESPGEPVLSTALAREALLAGELSLAEAALRCASPVRGLALRALLALVRGDVEGAVKSYALALSMRRKQVRVDALEGPEGALQPLAYLLHPAETRRKQARKLLANPPFQHAGARGLFGGHVHLARLDALVQGLPLPPSDTVTHPVAVLVAGLVAWWAGESLSSGVLEAARQRALAGGYRWLAAELDCLLVGDPHRAVPGARALVRLRDRSSDWERRLDAIEDLLGDAPQDGPALDEPSHRIAWYLAWDQASIALWARQQRRGRGGWSKGQRVTTQRLRTESVEGATDQDRRIAACSSIRQVRRWRGYSDEVEHWHPETTWPALVGHPAVFDHEQPDHRLDLVQRAPRLEVRREGAGIRMVVQPVLAPGRGVVVEQPSAERIELVIFDEAQRRATELLGDGLVLPEGAGGRVGALLARLAGVFEVHDDAALGTRARSLPHDPRPVLQLRPSGLGLVVQIRVRPFGQGGPVLEPGQGGELLLAQIDGESCRTQRDLEAERRAAAALDEALPTLGAADWRGDDRFLGGAEEALELLVELSRLGDAVRVEWPEGEPLRLKGELDTGSLHLAVRSRGDWFGASGELRVDRGLVLDLMQILELMERAPRRFVQLEDGQFVALTHALTRQLDLLARLGEARGGALWLHPLSVGALAPVLETVGGLDADEAWRAQVAAMHAPREHTHPVPRTLRAELRDYQREGYAWLCRLAELGAGACLADDMGLGKTVQVLALLLQRAWLGPALVVAPTSVCGGWCEQAWRFAPGLTVHRFGPGDREAVLAGLGPSDLVVCSYGLLQAERALFAAQRWSTVVLDEAQAIKNPGTHRHQAACALQAELRVVTTGTPIENHTGELWSLFRFLNPGLLGGWESFRVRFAEPIEAGDREVQQQLRRLVLPFVLRRTKSAVLSELPPRSEVDVQVELLPEERALYEAVRARAEAFLEQLDEPQPLQILAQLTKLRMACCNGAMVAEGGLAPESAKLAAFAEIVQQLHEGGHRALVFSGFVQHLALLRAWLDARGVAYQYLDGSTPAAQRDRAVRAFQAGEGELFLISLRAGGFGLNLTAADYVLHMDPWWNPAVEDQASDRAHRIGQQRPVTVYRLIARGTIEERILALHARKRELAEGILEGSDLTGRLSTSELLAMIREA